MIKGQTPFPFDIFGCFDRPVPQLPGLASRTESISAHRVLVAGPLPDWPLTKTMTGCCH